MKAGGSGTVVYTIAAANYLAQVRVLMASVKQHQPDWRRCLLVADPVAGRFDPAQEDFEVRQIEELDLPGGIHFFDTYSVIEACTALKPFMAHEFFRQGAQQVFFLDPDIQLFEPLREAEALLRGSLMVLTPHRLGPCESIEWERLFLFGGAFNLGFIGLACHPSLESFLSWWERCLTQDCIDNGKGYRFLDQRWIDQAPARFEGVRVLRHPGYNVAYWCLEERQLDQTPDGIRAQAQPLVFFHFSAFLPPPRLSVHLPAYQLAPASAVQTLATRYHADLLQAGWDQTKVWSWGWSYARVRADTWNPMLRYWRKHPAMQKRYPRPFDKDRWRAWAGFIEGMLPGLAPLVEFIRRGRRRLRPFIK
jgi:hypothetical protein